MSDLEQLLQQAELALSNLLQQSEREKVFAAESRNCFDKNIQVFEKYYPDIAKVIKEFKPRPDFRILVTSTGVGNFIPSHASVPIYSDDPIAQTREQLEKFTNNGIYSLTNYSFGVSEHDDRIHSRYMAELTHVVDGYRTLSPEKLTKLPQHFPSAILFGIGLGYVVTELFSKHSFDYIYISEPDIEIFYASLFCTDWSEIIRIIDENNGTLFLQIGLSVDEFFSAIHKIAGDIGAFSIVRSFCYQHYPSPEINKQIREFFTRYHELQLGFGFYNDSITGLAHCIQNYHGKAEFFVKPHLKKRITMPVAVVGNGPSLDASVEALKEIQDNVIIFACGTAFTSLIKYGIKPDFHVLVERPKTVYDTLLISLPTEIYKDMSLLAVDVIHPKVVELYDWVGLGLKGPESSTLLTQLICMSDYNLDMPSLPFCGPLVANTGLSYAFSLGFSEVYLFGVSNGYIEGKTHSVQSIYATDSRYKLGVPVDATIKVKGNLTQNVMATNLLDLARINMEKLIETDKKTTVYNVGEGAFIKGTLSLHQDDVFVMKTSVSKKDLIRSIKSSFFNKFDFEVSENRLAFYIFDEICDNLNKIASESFSTRKEAAQLLKRQAKYVYFFRKTRFIHLFYLIKGALLYFHCPMLTALYQYADDQLSLSIFRELLKLWVSYVEAMKLDYRESWNKSCDYGMEQHLRVLKKD
ncbi:MAG: DUF115 domain-containing protein [Alishewanella agri]|nr:DUF115 domain-containing protein [Alishewanella agri]